MGTPTRRIPGAGPGPDEIATKLICSEDTANGTVQSVTGTAVAVLEFTPNRDACADCGGYLWPDDGVTRRGGCVCFRIGAL